MQELWHLRCFAAACFAHQHNCGMVLQKVEDLGPARASVVSVTAIGIQECLRQKETWLKRRTAPVPRDGKPFSLLLERKMGIGVDG